MEALARHCPPSVGKGCRQADIRSHWLSATSVSGGPSSVEAPVTLGRAFLHHTMQRFSVRGGPRVTGSAFLCHGLRNSPRLLMGGRSLVFVQKTYSIRRLLCSRPAVTFTVRFSFVGGGGGGGVPVARLSTAPCPFSTSSDEEAPVPSRHDVETKALLREVCIKALLNHTLQPMWSQAV